MVEVAALYRYPVKGLSSESLTVLEIDADGRVVGDRVLGFRFADTIEPDDQWSSKHGMLALVNTPGLARLRADLDADAGRLAIHLDGELLVEDDLDAAGRERISAAVGEYARQLPTSAVGDGDDRAGRLPLRLVGDGVTPRHQDDPDPTVTLHSRASLHALGGRLDDAGLDEVRFRSNIVIDGVDAWSELAWLGGRIRIGRLTATVTRAKVRCLATHVNPATGERDRSVLKTLVQGFGQDEPTFAVALRFDGPGRIEVGDPVEPTD